VKAVLDSPRNRLWSRHGSAARAWTAIACLACGVTSLANGGQTAPLPTPPDATSTADTSNAAATPATVAPDSSAPGTTDINPGAGAAAGAATTVPDASLTDHYAAFRKAFDERNYAEAATHAQRVLTLTEQQAATPFDEDVQVALMNLALAQQMAGDFTAAEASYLRAIDSVEKSGRPLTTRLARANAGLAVTYHAGKRYDLAVQQFEQAIGLSRRHEGVLNKQQVPLLEKYSDSLTQLGRYQDALQAQKYILRVETRGLPEQDPRTAPALERIGRWYAGVGAYDQARRSLKKAIEVVARAEGDRSPALISPLVALADCNRRQLFDPSQPQSTSHENDRSTMFPDQGMAPPTLAPGMLATEGEKALLIAADIAESRAEPSLVQVADVRTQLGDWYQMRGQTDRALPNYLQAWQTAARVTDKAAGKELTELLFGKPTLLHFVRPEGWDRYAGRKPGEVEFRTVAANLTVDEQGRPQGIRITDDSGDAKRAEKTLQSIRTARYRPRFAEGRPVSTADVAFSQPWTVPLEPEPTPGNGDSKKQKASSDQSRPASAPRQAAAGHARSPVRETPRRA
jgi:tetratricopeptide (TPR) repeat protein